VEIRAGKLQQLKICCQLDSLCKDCFSNCSLRYILEKLNPKN
jgi:hypothetical protein